MSAQRSMSQHVTTSSQASITKERLDFLIFRELCNMHPMASAKARNVRHRKTHKLVQTWVSPEMKKALDVLARGEGRSLANYVRRELGKLVGIIE
jgi:hypothetical protein